MPNVKIKGEVLPVVVAGGADGEAAAVDSEEGEEGSRGGLVEGKKMLLELAWTGKENPKV